MNSEIWNNSYIPQSGCVHSIPGCAVSIYTCKICGYTIEKRCGNQPVVSAMIREHEEWEEMEAERKIWEREHCGYSFWNAYEESEDEDLETYYCVKGGKRKFNTVEI